MNNPSTLWNEVQRHHHSPGGGAAISSLTFDLYEELLWTGNSTGQISSLIYPSSSGSPSPLLRYSSYPAHSPYPVGQIINLENAIYSVAMENSRCCTRQGVTVWNKRLKNSTSISTTSLQSELIVASSEGQLSLLNVNRGVILKQIDVDEGINILKHGRYIFSASTSGNIVFWDPSTYKQEFSMKFHSGGVSSLDISGNYIATTGYTARGTSLIPDPLIKVLDLRTNKFLPPLPSSGGPLFVRFLPNYAGTILAGNRSGSLQISDINDSAQQRSIFLQASVSGFMTAMEFSSSGELFAIGDAFGTTQLWSQRPNPKVNNTSRKTLYKDMVTEITPKISDEMPLSTVGLPYYSKPLLSLWPNNLSFSVGRPATKIPAEVLKNVKMADFVGHAPNPKSQRRNQVSTPNYDDQPKKPKFRSEQELEQMKSGKKGSDIHQETNISIETGIPFHYRSVEIKYSRFGVEDFDFGFYNKTPYAGLETDIQNSYCNSLLQMLYFIWPLRELVKTHIRASCFKEPCLTCELGFLFKMLEGSNGVNCQASNFLRAFGLIRQANALGLLEPEQITPESTIAYGSLIQTFFRFLLEQMSQELSVPNSAVVGDRLLQKLFKIPLLSITCCNHNSAHSTEKETSPLMIDLTYPSSKSGNSTFAEVLTKSINRESITKAWCASCNVYQPTAQRKKLMEMPNFLCLNANIGSDADLQIWLDTKDHRWLPSTMALILSNGVLTVVDMDKSRVDPTAFSPDAEIAIFDLRATIAEVKIKKGPGHLVAHINVSESEEPKWFFFNDFSVLAVENEERVFQTWKIPAIIQYARRTAETSSSFFLSPVNPDFRILLDNHLLNQRPDLNIRYLPLSPEEIPYQPGFLCAIDAEFVIMSAAESEVRSDGTTTMIKPPRYSLARVSVVRGEDYQQGVPFIDDYICTTEPVCDYLTEYSGIQDGDLDPVQSRHPLVSLKVAYKRLRLLVDMGCIFVGHDLRKDCRTINIHIPPSQIIDTVNIFRFKNRQRKLSLRFLAWCLLKQDIQTVTHDSVEDARTALSLYLKYLEIKERGNFQQVMEYIESEGKALSFRVPT